MVPSGVLVPDVICIEPMRTVPGGSTAYERAARRTARRSTRGTVILILLIMTAVGRNIPHDSARGHVTGESVYIDDMPPLRGEVIVDFYWSPVAHGRIRSVDTTRACSVPGVVALFSHHDLAHNVFGPIIQDEVLLAE